MRLVVRCILWMNVCFLKWSVVLLISFIFLGGPLRAEGAPAKTFAEKWVSAISNDRTDLLVQMLSTRLNEKADALDLLQQDAPNGKSALMVASKQGELALVKRMVELGADVNELTATGGTPLMFAVLGNHIDVAHWLYSEGASINAQGSNGWSAATIAGAKGQPGMLQWLIKAGADINAQDIYRFTPLMRAVDNEHVASALILLKQGQAGVYYKDESDNTALHFAVANKHRALVQLLMSYGANPLQANRDGITPSDLAMEVPSIADLF